MTDAYTERMIWQLSWKGIELSRIAHLVGISENEVARVLAGSRGEPTAAEGEARP